MKYEIGFSGHKNIRSHHKKTIEITTDSDLTVNGDCIIGVNATHGCSGLPPDIKQKLQEPSSTLKITIRVKNYEFEIIGSGHADLTLSHNEDIVIRKSNFVCPRTLAVQCDKASDVIPREIISELQHPETRGTFAIEIQ